MGGWQQPPFTHDFAHKWTTLIGYSHERDTYKSPRGATSGCTGPSAPCSPLKRLTVPVDKQFKILALIYWIWFKMFWQLRGCRLQNIFKTFRIKLRLMVWFTIIEKASSVRDCEERQEASYHAGIFGMSAKRLATDKWGCPSFHNFRVPMVAWWPPWVLVSDSGIGDRRSRTVMARCFWRTPSLKIRIIKINKKLFLRALTIIISESTIINLESKAKARESYEALQRLWLLNDRQYLFQLVTSAHHPREVLSHFIWHNKSL